jgi:carboxyl-terminal processing protease
MAGRGRLASVMPWCRTLAALAIAAFALLPVREAARAAAPPACPGGRYAVSGDDLLAGAVLPGADSVFIDAGRIAVASGCTSAAVKLKVTRRGTKAKAVWESCEGAVGKVKLAARIDPGCTTLTGKLTARKSKLKRAFTATLVPSAVRACDFVPGESVPAVMPPEVVNPPPPPPPPPIELPAPTPVPAATTAAQLAVFDELWSAVSESYVDPQLGGRDWDAIGDAYEALVEQGLTPEDFGTAMRALIAELGDEHSHYQTAQEVADEAERFATGRTYVGIGVLMSGNRDTQTGSILGIFSGSPAEAAGLRLHDLLLEVDGLPLRDESGVARTLGPAGTSLALTFARPGEPPATITMTRQQVSGFLPVARCLVPGTRIGYVLLPTFLDPTIDDSLRAALQDLSLGGPLAGLVVDDRMNGGGFGAVLDVALGFFTGGPQGQFVARDDAATPFAVFAEDVAGSQTVPLVVLTDADTVSYGEIFAGVLQRSGRATLVGGPTAGNVEQLLSYAFADGSRAWLATRTFQPVGLAPSAWEGVGVLPDVPKPTRWDLFTEASDPALAEAIRILQGP